MSGVKDNIQRFCANWENIGVQQAFASGYGGQYYNECANKPEDRPFSFVQKAHSGKGMAQILNTNAGFFQERIFYGIKLITSLKIGHRYAVSFFINLADSSCSAMNNIGVLFCTQKIKIIDTSNITSVCYPNRAQVYSKNVIEDKINWVEIKGSFIADSAYNYMVVGNLFDYKKTTYKNLDCTGALEYPAYLIDDFTVEEINNSIQINNKLICKGDSAILQVTGNLSQFYWSLNKSDTLSTLNRIKLKVDSSFMIYLISEYIIDSLNITAIDWPVKKIPIDTFLCNGYYVEIDGSAQNAIYKWSTGNLSPLLRIKEEGNYILETITGSCNRYDTLHVFSCLYVPNAFTPNGDNENDVFSPIGLRAYNYHLLIFNKWGQQLFQSTDISKGWDGEGQTTDVYFYRITYTSVEGTHVYEQKGNFTLLK